MQQHPPTSEGSAPGPLNLLVIFCSFPHPPTQPMSYLKWEMTLAKLMMPLNM